MRRMHWESLEHLALQHGLRKDQLDSGTGVCVESCAPLRSGHFMLCRDVLTAEEASQSIVKAV